MFPPPVHSACIALGPGLEFPICAFKRSLFYKLLALILLVRLFAYHGIFFSISLSAELHDVTQLSPLLPSAPISSILLHSPPLLQIAILTCPIFKLSSTFIISLPLLYISSSASLHNLDISSLGGRT
ncbi:hypothetical protein BD779DRAFT_1545693 [Infundibulicybe gibba]|nr:hypothetical protein BD779DRAFT_1545693 [Infundibulicybe gibba]